MALMPMAIKCGPSDQGTLCEQFSCCLRLRGNVAEKLIEGWWQTLVTLERF